MYLSTNAQGDRLEVHTDIITLNLDYWDCECELEYIHSNKESVCQHCNSTESNSPCAHESEVQELVYNK